MKKKEITSKDMSLFNHPAINDLIEIVSMEDDNAFTFKHMKVEKRKLALMKWIKENIVEVTNTQLTVNSKAMDLENHDLICETIVHQCVDELIESNSVQFTIKERSYSVTLWSLRNRRHFNEK